MAVELIGDGTPKAKEPAPGRGWANFGDVTVEMRRKLGQTNVVHAMKFVRKDVLVFSAVEKTNRGFEWHVSVSLASPVIGGSARRAPRSVVRKVRRDFGLEQAEEDNHVPHGFVRNLWLTCDPDHRGECECVDEGPPIVEPFGEPGGDEGDDYEWRP